MLSGQINKFGPVRADTVRRSLFILDITSYDERQSYGSKKLFDKDVDSESQCDGLALYVVHLYTRHVEGASCKDNRLQERISRYVG